MVDDPDNDGRLTSSSSRRSGSNLYAPRPSAPQLEELLAAIASADDAAALDRALRLARAHYAGSMMEQLEGAAAERANFLLITLDGPGEPA